MAVPDVFGPIDAVTKQAYSDNVLLQTQLKTDKLMGCFTPLEGLKGREFQAVELVGAFEADINAPTNVPQERKTPRHEGVYVYPQRISAGFTIPKNYPIEALREYTSPYTQALSAAFVRAKTSLTMQSITGPRYMRNDNTGAINSVAYDWTNRIVANNYQYGGGGATSNMTVQKFIKGMELLGATSLDLDYEDLICAMTVKQNTALYQNLQVTNWYNTGRFQLEDKFVRSFMGVKILIFGTSSAGNTAIMPVGLDPTGSYRACPMWAKSRVFVGDAEPFSLQIERNPGLQYQPDAWAEEWIGMTRSEDEGVVAILCDETVT
jgi:hypothetical protein